MIFCGLHNSRMINLVLEKLVCFLSTWDLLIGYSTPIIRRFTLMECLHTKEWYVIRLLLAKVCCLLHICLFCLHYPLPYSSTVWNIVPTARTYYPSFLLIFADDLCYLPILHWFWIKWSTGLYFLSQKNFRLQILYPLQTLLAGVLRTKLQHSPLLGAKF